MTKSSESATPRVLHRRLLSMLQLERSLFGHGAAAELDRRVGKSEGYLGRVLRGEIGLQAELLFKVLDAFELNPAEFFTLLTGAEASPKRCLQRFARTLERPSMESVLPMSRQLVKALRGLETSPTSIREVQRCHAWKDKALLAQGRSIFREMFSADEDANILIPTAELVATAYDAYVQGAASGRALAVALKLAAAVERQHRRAGAGVFWLVIALEVTNGTTEEVELLVEAAHLLVTGRQLVASGLVIDRAQRQAICLGDGPTLGKTLLSRGALELAQGRPFEAAVAYEASFRYLEGEDWRARVVAHHGAARGHLEDENLFKAGWHLTQAAALHRTRCGPCWRRLQWTQGNWAYASARKPSDYEQSVQLYDAALAGLDTKRQPLDVVRLLLHKSKALLALRAPKRLRHTAAAGLQLERVLKRQTEVHRLLLEFARLAMTGEVTKAWLDAALAKLSPV